MSHCSTKISTEACLPAVDPLYFGGRRVATAVEPKFGGSAVLPLPRGIHINICRVSFGGVFNMLLVLSITFHFHYNIWGCMCSAGSFQYRWLKGYIYSSYYYHHHIGSIHLSHCYHISPWLCAWDVSYIIFCHLLHIGSGKTGNLFSLLLCSLWWVLIVGYVLACRSYSFVCTLHHPIIIIVQTYLKTLDL